MTDMTTERERWAALYVLCTGMLMIVLDLTVVNVALPSIKDDLGFSFSSLAWVVNSYMVAFAGLLLLSGRLGDLLGRRNVFLSGLGVFTVASVLCGAAQSQTMLVAARFLQGVGGALASAVILGMIVTMFPEPREQAKAMGVYGFVASGGGTVGLLAGGVITQVISWHWIFFINIPIGIATAILAVRLIPDDEGLGIGEGADYLGAVLATVALMLGVYAIVQAHSWAQGTLSLVLLAAFIWREAVAANPLMPLTIFRSRRLSGANVIQVPWVAGMFGMFFLGALYMQEVLGYDALQIGLAFLPCTLVMGVLSLRYAQPLCNRFGAQRVLFAGLVCIVTAFVLLARVPTDGHYLPDLLPAMLLFGVGSGPSFPAFMTLAMADVRKDEAGLASGLMNTTTEAGAALGLAVLATVAAAHTRGLVAAGTGRATALTGGYRLAFGIGAGLVLTSLVVAIAVFRGGLPHHSTEHADEFALAES
jgi:EmrB/QacA subfamily drug resistance transporter